MSKPAWIDQLKTKTEDSPAPLPAKKVTPDWVSKLKQKETPEQPTPESEMGAFEAGARAAGQGITWGFSDEITAGIESTFSNKPYEKALEEQRLKLKQAQESHPELYTGAEITSTVVRDAGLMLVPGLNFLRTLNIAKGVAVGAADGALAAWGRTEAQAPKQVAQDILEGAAWGGGAFGAVGALTKGISVAAKAAATKYPKSNPAKTTSMLQSLELDAMKEGKVSSGTRVAEQADFIAKEGGGMWDEATTFARTNIKKADKLLSGPKGWDQEFMEWKMLKPAGHNFSAEDIDKLEQMWNGLNAEGQKSMVYNYLFGQGLQKSYKKLLATAEGKAYVGGLSDPFESKILTKMRAPSQNADLIDNKLKTNMRGIISQASRAEDLTMQGAAPFLTRQYELAKLAKKNKVSEDTIRQSLLGTLEKPVSPEAQEVLKGYRKWFDDARESLIKDGLQINHQTDYLSRMSVNIVDTRVVMQRRLDKILAKKASSAEISEFYSTAKYLFPDLPKGAKGPEIARRIDELTDLSKVTERGSVPEAFAVFSRREGEFPKMLQEQKIDKIMTNYILMNYKALHMRSPLEQLQSHISLFRGMEMEKTAQVWEDYYRQLTSTPGNFQAALNGTSAKLKIAGERMLEKGGFSAMAGDVVKEIPDFASWTATQIYPNYLGWNLHAPIRNMFQTWFVTAPELKGAYGYNAVRKGWVRAAAQMAKGERITNFLNKKGLQAPDFNNEGMINTVSEGLGPIGPLGKGIDFLGKKGLYLYSMSDSANRYLTYYTAQHVAEDLIRKTAASKKFLNSVRAGPRQVLERALREGNDQTLRDELATYLIDKTQFKYTRAELSQFAREYGRVYNMFTKWPTMIIGDLEYSFRNREGMDKVLEPFQKYVTPLMLLTGIQTYLDNTEGVDPKLQLFIGKDLSKWSPFSAVTGLSAPPLLQIPKAAFRSIEHVSKGEVNRAANELGKAGQPFVPGLYFKKLYEKVEEVSK